MIIEFTLREQTVPCSWVKLLKSLHRKLSEGTEQDEKSAWLV